MMFKDVIELVSFDIIKDELHQEIEIESNRLVFANKKSASQSEFFNAGQNGFKPQYVFTVRLIDYDEESLLLFNEKRYSIYRTYETGENMELYCELKVGA